MPLSQHKLPLRPTLVQHWSNTGSTLVQHWSNTGPTGQVDRLEGYLYTGDALLSNKLQLYSSIHLYAPPGPPGPPGPSGPSASGCNASNNDGDCCSSSNKCGIGEGDCDKDSHCADNLVCGDDNCKSFDSAWSSSRDCCTTKGKTKHTKSLGV